MTSTQEKTDLPTPEKRVRFYARVKFRKQAASKTEEELKENWYSNEDIITARRTEKALRDYFSDHEHLQKDSAENLKLLGFRTEEERKKKSKTYRQSMLAVLREQFKQEERFINETEDDDTVLFFLDFDAISDCYTVEAKEACEEALERGSRVASFVEEQRKIPDMSQYTAPLKPCRRSSSPPKDSEEMSNSPPRSPTMQNPSKRVFTNAAA